MNAVTDDPGFALRVPPHSTTAEHGLIGCVLLDPSAFDRVADRIRSDDFYNWPHQRIWEAISALHAGRRPADVITVDQWLTDKGHDCGGAEYLNAMAMQVPNANAAQQYAEIVADKGLRRRIIAALDAASALAWDSGESTAKECIDKACTELLALERSDEGRGPKWLADLLPERADRLQRMFEGHEEAGIRTGLFELDRALGGGLKPGNTYIIAARPGVGKSSLSLAIGLEVAKAGRKVLMLSQEMPNSEVADRAIACIAGADYGGIRTGKFADDESMNAVVDGLDQCISLPFAVDDQPSLRLSNIRTKVRAVRGCELLIVDYLQLCAAESKSQNRNGEVEEISRGLKALAKDFGIPVIVLSQLSRSIESRGDKEPQLSDLRDSGAIEQDADVVMLLWEYRDNGNGTSLVGLKVGKNRQGQRSKLMLAFDGTRQRWGVSTEDFSEPPRAEQTKRRVL